MFGYVAVFVVGVYCAPAVKKKIKQIRSTYGV